jgi:hypothetical protein
VNSILKRSVTILVLISKTLANKALVLNDEVTIALSSNLTYTSLQTRRCFITEIAG